MEIYRSDLYNIHKVIVDKLSTSKDLQLQPWLIEAAQLAQAACGDHPSPEDLESFFTPQAIDHIKKIHGSDI